MSAMVEIRDDMELVGAGGTEVGAGMVDIINLLF
jgi:hypothetical protein